MSANRSLIVGSLLIGALAAAALLGPMLAPHGPTVQNLEADLLAPSAGHWLGTDKLGRDVLSRLLHGARFSLAIALTTVALSLFVGASLGSICGYFGGWLDHTLMRLVDIVLAFPGILLAIAFAALLGPGFYPVVLALSLGGWTAYARTARAQVLWLRETEFVWAARALGGHPGRILARHIAPHVLPALSIQASFGMAAAILGEGALSFLGLGVQPPDPSWGSMLAEGRQFLLVAPHLTTFPGLALMLTLLAFNLVGEGLSGSSPGKRPT
jgi:peptide/nickel transport system permease protein